MKIGNRTYEGWTLAEQCPVCGSKDSQPLSRDVYIVTISPIGDASLPLYVPLTYLRCGGCEVEYQEWRLNDEALNIYYTTDIYRQFIDANNREKRDHDAKRWVTPMLTILKDEGIEPLQHLDFGCSQAVLLRNVPWEGVGVEIAEGAREHALKYGAEVYRSLDDVEGLFDFVTIIETLEHLPHPRETLQDLVDKMIEGGVMLITVPWSGLHTGAKNLHHLMAYTAEALVNLTESVGLRTRQIMQLVVAREEDGGDRRATRLMYLGEKHEDRE